VPGRTSEEDRPLGELLSGRTERESARKKRDDGVRGKLEDRRFEGKRCRRSG
jgi:hypothetical protein